MHYYTMNFGGMIMAEIVNAAEETKEVVYPLFYVLVMVSYFFSNPHQC